MSQHTIGGWVWYSSTELLFEYLASWIGYDFGESDWQAIEVALPSTDADREDGWYEYPLIGDVVLTVRVADNPGDDIVTFEISGEIDAVLRARIETAFSILTHPLVGR